MVQRTYGAKPWDLGEINVALPEVYYCLYLPISLKGESRLVLPQALAPLMPIVDAIYKDLGPEAWDNNYVYLTCKKMFVSPTITANRPGWHADGFGSDDLNYVWYDCLPTEIAEGNNFNITEGDHVRSLFEFETQAQRNVITTYPNKHLIKLDPYVVHRVAVAHEQMMRTFVKVSVSKDQYNLKDNSINHEMNYNFKLYDREMVRNSPQVAQADSYKPGPDDDHFA